MRFVRQFPGSYVAEVHATVRRALKSSEVLTELSEVR
jgi:hypothetical protein